MLLNWKIRYIDTRSKQLNDREVWLDTDTLEPNQKHDVELYCKNKPIGHPDICKFRKLFVEKTYSENELEKLLKSNTKFRLFCVADYFEDENANVLTVQQISELRHKK